LAASLGTTGRWTPPYPTTQFPSRPRSSFSAPAWLGWASGGGSGVGKRSKPRLETRALDLTTDPHPWAGSIDTRPAPFFLVSPPFFFPRSIAPPIAPALATP